MLVLGGTLAIFSSVVPKHWLLSRAMWLKPQESWLNQTGAPQKSDSKGRSEMEWALYIYKIPQVTADFSHISPALLIYTHTHTLLL